MFKISIFYIDSVVTQTKREVHIYSNIYVAYMQHKHEIFKISKSANKKQKTLTDIFIKGNVRPVESNTKDAKFLLARRMSLWFCRSLLPFNYISTSCIM